MYFENTLKIQIQTIVCVNNRTTLGIENNNIFLILTHLIAPEGIVIDIVRRIHVEIPLIKSTKMNKALIISIAFNVIFVLIFAGKRYYYSYGAGVGKDNYASWIQMRNSVYNSLPSDTSDIVFVGNSLVEVFPVTEIFGPHVKNRGIGSNLTAHILDRIGPISQRHPKKIFIEMGVNDLQAGRSVDSMLLNYSKVIQAIKHLSPTTEIIIQSLTPTSQEYALLNDQIVLSNERLKEICSKVDIIYIDLYKPMEANGQLDNTLTSDGLHLNAKGYEIWEKKIEKYLY